ncbi:MAG: hypothetical protein JJU18_05760 [Oceanicaulis sp.]|nr:hypothetical protein [Oceanicaulis sp.]
MSNASMTDYEWNLPSHGSGENESIPGATNDGRWQTGLCDLEKLGDALKVHADRMADVAQVKSVPDIWGHTIAFRNALFNPDPEDQLQKQAVSQWRGLLTLIGLRQMQSSVYTLDMIEIRTDEAPENGLTRLAGDFRPALSIDKNFNTKVIHLLFIECEARRSLVGVLTPDTLVAPGRNVGLVSIANTRWFQKGPACPLANGAGLSPEQELALAAFVEGLANAVKQAPVAAARSRGDSVRSSLRRLLDEFAAELRNSSGEDARAQPELRAVQTIGPSAGILAALDKVYAPGEIDEDATDLMVNLRSDLPEGEDRSVFKGFVLADPKFAERHGRRADRVTVWRERRLSEVADPRTFESVREDALKSRYLLIRPEDIFTDVFVPFSSNTIAAHADALKGGLLPLKPIILMMMSPEEIAENFKLVEHRKGRWVFELTVSVITNDARSKVVRHTLVKEYVTSDARSEARWDKPGLVVANAGMGFRLDAPDTLAAWPNFKHPEWRWNFLYFKTPHHAAIPLTGISGDILRRDLSQATTMPGRLARLEQWSRLNQNGECERWPGTETREPEDAPPWFERIAIDQHSPRGGQHQTEVQRCDVPFEAVTFRCEAESDLVGPDDAQTYFAGLGLLPALSSPPQMPEAKATLAIDFGTTNTTVYYQLNGMNECRFQPRLRLFSTIEHGAGSKPYAGFMPSSIIAQPFGTILADRTLNRHGETYPDWRNMGTPEPALWRSHIAFGEDFQELLSGLLPQESDRSAGKSPPAAASDRQLRFGFKWSAEEGDRDAINRFLMHCVVLSLAELCAQGVTPSHVDWRFSFPTAMKTDDARDYFDRASQIVTVASGEHAKTKLATTTEAEAAAVYFREAFKADIPRSYLVLDIGGGTTDISVWTYKGQLWSGSFLLAGADLMLDFVIKNKDFLDALAVETDDMLGKHKARELLKALPQQQRSDTPADKTIAFLVNTEAFRKRFNERRSSISGRREVRKLHAGARLMLGGLLYYSGMQVRGLLEHPEFSKNVDPDAFDAIRIAFAGRGSTLFNQMHGDGANSKLTGAFALFNAGRNQSNDPDDDLKASLSPEDIKFSPVPKHEVALGMLHMMEDELVNLGQALDSKRGRRADFMVSGEVITGPPDAASDNQSIVVNAMDSVFDLTTRLKDKHLEVQSLQQFDRFLTALRVNTGLQLHLNQNVRKTLQEALRLEAEAWTGATSLKGSDSLRRPEPPFIRLLRETLSRLYSEPGQGVSENSVIGFDMEQ